MRRLGKWRYLIILGGVLLGLRAALPWAVEWYVNRQLAAHPDYAGRVDDVDLQLIRGAYQLEDIRIHQTQGEVPVPLFAAERVDLSLYWTQIFNGALVGEIEMYQPQLNFVDGGKKGASQTGAGRDWAELVRSLFPFRIDRVALNGGELHFRNFHSEPPIDVYLQAVEGELRNLTNSEQLADSLWASAELTALAMADAKVEFSLALNPYADRAHFDLDLRLLGLDVTRLNDLIKAYADFDLEQGQADLIIELAVDNGRLDGYAKPLFRNLKVLSWKGDVEQDGDNPLKLFWEALVGAAGEIFENQEKDQLGTRIPLSGEVDDPDASVLATLGGVLRNAFVRAFLPRLERSVELEE